MPHLARRLPFGPFRNSDLFSNHWLEIRLPLEPEWTEHRNQAFATLGELEKLWAIERKRVEKYGNEQGLEQAFIQPVLQALGWKLVYQTFLRGRKPDYALFLDEAAKDAALRADRSSQDFWHHPAIVADAKAWHVSLDWPTKVKNVREYPPEQIESYLNMSLLAYGILTNGKLWRLVPREFDHDQRRFQTYVEFDLGAFLDDWRNRGDAKGQGEFSLFDDFFRFYLLFGPVAHRAVADREPLILRAKKGSSEYRLGIGEDLKERVFEGLRLCIEGFLRHSPNQLDPAGDLARAREQSFIFLYRLLFTLYAEDRRLLPYHVNPTYTENRSLGRLRGDIAGQLDLARERGGKPYSDSSTAIWDQLCSLFDLIDGGHKTYGVPAYNGGLFDPEANPFLMEKKIADTYLARVIDCLSRAKDEDHPQAGLYRVDYRDLQIQHLGSIYEGLLELQPHIATEPLIIIRPQAPSRRLEDKVIPAKAPMPEGYEPSDTIYQPGDVYTLTDKGERRATGSYYTPNRIVDYIVESSVGPLCKQVDARLRAEIAAAENAHADAPADRKRELAKALQGLKENYDDRVLALRILDPAMGSGHFLLQACQFLAEEIATHPYAADPTIGASLPSESAITFWKRRVVERCLFGVDKNPLAVELAKLALWLETVSTDQPLTFLDHHLRHGNSLVGAGVEELDTLPSTGLLFQNAVSKQVYAKLPAMLAPLAEIRAMPSNTTAEVKAKDKTYRQVFDKVRRPFLKVAHLWAATFYLPQDKHPNPKEYQSVLDVLGNPVKLAKLTEEPWFAAALARAEQPDAVFFHWELEFPEVFYGENGRRPDAGFDGIIGNPPYDVLSEKETGLDLSAFRSFIEHEPRYAPSRRGKNNLYKLFICRALALLAEGGRLGFIVPMPLLGDDQAADLRKAILAQGALTSVDAFPQKDDPKKRVFPEAKLSTAVFTVLKTAHAATKERPFLARVHPADRVSSDSPGLTLRTSDIPLYDPVNMSIVSCSQADWDLAVRLMQSGRMHRLVGYCTSFQGEVNETNEKKKGCLSKTQRDGPLVMRGANVCLYAIREASQGEDLFLRTGKFYEGKSADTKAYHAKQWRVGFQRSSPQNNFRRIVAGIVEPNTFCFDTISYVPVSDSQLPLPFLLALLNSKLLDWYFRLGSTNSKVNEYQFNNLPCPVFAAESAADDRKALAGAVKAVEKMDMGMAFECVKDGLSTPPFGCAVRDLMVELVKRIIAVEKDRKLSSRSDRSALAREAQPYQDLLDRLLYAMAGLSDQEVKGLEERLAKML